MNKHDVLIDELLSGWDIRRNVYEARDAGKINKGFKRHLYAYVNQERESPFNKTMLDYLSIVIEQTEPSLSNVAQPVRDAYVEKINEAITSPNIAAKLEALLLESKEDGLPSDEFIQFLRDCLDRSDLSPLVQQLSLDLCVKKLNE